MHFKPNNLDPGFDPRLECIVVTPIFTADIPIAPNSQTQGFPGDLLTQKAMFLIQHDILTLINVISIEICEWV